jgi:hypothetical protein
LLPESPGTPSGRPAARTGRSFVSRDWVIPIDCTADAVELLIGRQRFTTHALLTAKPGDNPLLKAVREVIERRQAMVRPGDPPYRPIIRFQVYPDGLQSYYVAFPVLETLQVPMTRENIRKADERK